MKISIITAYYNGRRFLPRFVRMIMRNVSSISKSDSIEVVIVNDSPLDTLTTADIRDIIEANCKSECTFAIDRERLTVGYRDRHYDIVLITNESNQGIHMSRIRGLGRASGEYIIFLDQDDLLSKNAIRTYIERAARTPEVLVSNAIIQRGGSYIEWFRSKYHTTLIGDMDTYLSVGIQIISPGQCCIYRGAIPDEWCEYICTNNGADDYFLWLLMLALSIPFRYVEGRLYMHSFTGSNLSDDTTVTDESTYEFAEYLRRIEYFPDKYADRLLRMISYKAKFRRAGRLSQIISSLMNLDILLVNVIYKIKTKTPLGFNR